jgi:hypothetical protein
MPQAFYVSLFFKLSVIFCHSGLDPESSRFALDSGFRQNDNCIYLK